MAIMVNKSNFAKYIKEKRIKKGLTQEQLAEQLIISTSAVSKWERGVTYPDITLISKICEVLDISEHEFVTACDDTDARQTMHEAIKYRKLSRAAFWTAQAAFLIPLIVCFIVNLAVQHTLSWFFIVTAALLVGYSILVLPFVLKRHKSLLSMTAATVSVALLLITCRIFGTVEFSLVTAFLIFFFWALPAWGIWGSIVYTRHAAAFTLILVGLFMAVFPYMVKLLVGEESHNLPFINEIIGILLIFIGIIIFFTQIIKNIINRKV